MQAVTEQLWLAVQRVAAMDHPAPFHRHLTELSTALAGAQVLLWQATAPTPDALELELATVAVDHLEDLARTVGRRIEDRRDRGALKRLLRQRLDPR